jgi:hypothetical protein
MKEAEIEREKEIKKESGERDKDIKWRKRQR